MGDRFRNPNSEIRNRTTILNVDDDDASRYVISHILRQAGFEVMEAANGAETLHLVKENPDLVILDVNLPDISGFEVCWRIKADRAASLMPVLMLSATYLDDKSMVKGLDSGADGYLMHPVEPPVLIATVKALLRTRQAQEALRENEERLRSLFETMAEGVVVIAPDGQIVQANPVAERILGLQRSEIESRNYVSPEWEILRPDGTPMPPEEMAGPRAMKEKRLVKDVVMGVKRPDDSIAWINVSATPLISEAGELEGVVGTFADITERKQAEEKLAYMATHDTLTGLPNQMLFNDRLILELAHAHRNRRKLALMLLDLDRFKDVNDTLGHSVGDQLLHRVGERLTSLLRKSDTIARMGGDEFMLISPEIARVQDAAKIANKILEAVREPFVLDEHELHITTSIGIAIYPYDGEDTDTLMRNADIAMYRAKEEGRDNYQRYTAAMNAKASE